MRTLTVWTTLLLTMACGSGKGTEDDSPGDDGGTADAGDGDADTDADSDSDSDADGDADADCDLSGLCGGGFIGWSFTAPGVVAETVANSDFDCAGPRGWLDYAGGNTNSSEPVEVGPGLYRFNIHLVDIDRYVVEETENGEIVTPYGSVSFEDGCGPVDVSPTENQRDFLEYREIIATHDPLEVRRGNYFICKLLDGCRL